MTVTVVGSSGLILVKRMEIFISRIWRLTAWKKIDNVKSSLIRDVSSCEIVNSVHYGHNGLCVLKLTHESTNEVLVINSVETKSFHRLVYSAIR